MTPREQIIAQVSRAQGVLMTLYGLVRDIEIASLVDDGKTGELGGVVMDTIHGLNRVVDLWDGVEDEGEAQEH